MSIQGHVQYLVIQRHLVCLDRGTNDLGKHFTVLRLSYRRLENGSMIKILLNLCFSYPLKIVYAFNGLLEEFRNIGVMILLILPLKEKKLLH